MKITLLVLAFSFVFGALQAQSFANIDELLQLSEMDPLECEKTLTAKGFRFIETDGLKSQYRNSSEYVVYQISPRRTNYKTMNRMFFLEVNSRLIKQGFVLINSEATLEGQNTKIKAQEYEKGKLTVWLFTDKDGGETTYNIQVDNNSPSSTKKSATTSKKSDFKYKGDKEKIDYGYFSIGLIIPRGVITEAPDPNTSYYQDYNGLSGIGATVGVEGAVGGVIGLTPLNQKLPHALDFGILLHGQFGVQPHSYKSLGGLYEDYSYSALMRAGAGVGPALVVTPFRDADFHLTFYYKMEAGINFDGGFEYVGGENFDETVARESVSFAWIKSYGIHIYGGSVFGGVEFSNYTDKGTFNVTQSYFDANDQYISNASTFDAALPVKQITVKIGLAF